MSILFWLQHYYLLIHQDWQQKTVSFYQILNQMVNRINKYFFKYLHSYRFILKTISTKKKGIISTILLWDKLKYRYNYIIGILRNQ